MRYSLLTSGLVGETDKYITYSSVIRFIINEDRKERHVDETSGGDSGLASIRK